MGKWATCTPQSSLGSADTLSKDQSQSFEGYHGKMPNYCERFDSVSLSRARWKKPTRTNLFDPNREIQLRAGELSVICLRNTDADRG